MEQLQLKQNGEYRLDLESIKESVERQTDYTLTDLHFFRGYFNVSKKDADFVLGSYLFKLNQYIAGEEVEQRTITLSLLNVLNIINSNIKWQYNDYAEQSITNIKSLEEDFPDSIYHARGYCPAQDSEEDATGEGSYWTEWDELTSEDLINKLSDTDYQIDYWQITLDDCWY